MSELNYQTASTHWRYEPETGNVFWLEKKRGVPESLLAGAVNDEKRIIIGLKGRRYYAHRIAWVLMTKKPAPKIIDHINGNPSDNRWINLRVADDVTNQANLKKFPRGTVKRQHGFEASIRVGGKKKYLGIFTTEEQAHVAYVDAHKSVHGEFSCYSDR